MADKLEISFNSPQCGWMSIGFKDGANEFHTTTAHAPHETALPDLMKLLTNLAAAAEDQDSKDSFAPKRYLLKWNRDPEEFDLEFIRNGDELTINIFQYPTDERDAAERSLVFSHTGPLRDAINAFAGTFSQLYEDRDTDEFEFNWRQPFPHREYEEFKARTT